MFSSSLNACTSSSSCVCAQSRYSWPPILDFNRFKILLLGRLEGTWWLLWSPSLLWGAKIVSKTLLWSAFNVPVENQSKKVALVLIRLVSVVKQYNNTCSYKFNIQRYTSLHFLLAVLKGTQRVPPTWIINTDFTYRSLSCWSSPTSHASMQWRLHCEVGRPWPWQILQKIDPPIFGSIPAQ